MSFQYFNNGYFVELPPKASHDYKWMENDLANPRTVVFRLLAGIPDSIQGSFLFRIFHQKRKKAIVGGSSSIC